jgi:hypothetical protein
MAHVVTRDAPVLQQALHGYADGHRLLASSIPLKGRDAKTMLTLSDASGSSSRIEDSGYMTGYPLAEARLYALAKTWPAPEMPRPGCVWTHTLLVDFADLATLETLATLVEWFQRPRVAANGFEAYGAPILLPPTGPHQDLRTIVDHGALRRLAWALYGQPHARVISSEGSLDERASHVLLLWGQQWPRLRRSFRFCTLVYTDRSTEGAPFDLQFAPLADRSIRSRFAKLLDADREPDDSPPAWLEDAVEDLVAGGGDGVLRSFLREVAAELSGGRELFEPLCRIHRYLNQEGDGGIGEVIQLLDGPLKGAPVRGVRARLVTRISETAPHAGPRELRFVLEHLELLSDEVRLQTASDLGAALWKVEPTLAAECLDGDDARRLVVLRGLSAAKAEDLLSVLRTRPSLLPSLLEHRRDLLARPEFWAEPALAQQALAQVPREPIAPEWLDAMIDAENRSLVPPACRTLGAERVLSRLFARLDARHADEFSSAEESWFLSASSPNALASVFSDGHIEERSTIAACAHRVRPDDVPNDYGEDPCWTAFRKAREQEVLRQRLYLRAWLLSRGLGSRSRNQAELIAAGIEDIYPAALGTRLPDESWHLLDGRLPNSYFWSDWDRGHRLRAGVANAFVSRELAPAVFGQLMGDDALFAELATEASGVLWGRGYLRNVKRALQDLGAARFANRIAIVQRLL